MTLIFLKSQYKSFSSIKFSLASYFGAVKLINTYLTLNNRDVCREYLAFKSYGASAVDGKSFLESNGSSIRETLM